MIRNNLKELMKIRNVKTSEVAKATGVSRISINNIKENRTNGINYKTLNALCKYFKCNIEDILHQF